MIRTENQIATDIKAYIEKHGGPYSSWYVGIAENPETRLFIDHTVNKAIGLWIYDNAGSADSARKIERYFVETLGTDGGTGGGDYNTIWAYAYKKAYNTKP